MLENLARNVGLEVSYIVQLPSKEPAAAQALHVVFDKRAPKRTWIQPASESLMSKLPRGCVSSLELRESTQLFEVRAKAQGHVFPALIDSGATHSFIAADAARQLGAVSIVDVLPLHTTLADGSGIASEQGVAVELTLACEDGSVERQPWVLPTVEQLHSKIVLGMDWLQMAQPAIEWIGFKASLPLGKFVQRVNGAAVVGEKVELVMPKGILHTMQATKQHGRFGLVRPVLGAESTLERLNGTVASSYYEYADCQHICRTLPANVARTRSPHRTREPYPGASKAQVILFITC